jgi:hypothetical protein
MSVGAVVCTSMLPGAIICSVEWTGISLGRVVPGRSCVFLYIIEDVGDVDKLGRQDGEEGTLHSVAVELNCQRASSMAQGKLGDGSKSPSSTTKRFFRDEYIPSGVNTPMS